MFGEYFDLVMLAQAKPTSIGGVTDPTAWLAFIKSVGIILGVFVLPFVVGRALAKWLRMNTHALSIGVVLATISASAIICSLGTIKYGIDIKGGTILVYEIDKTSEIGKEQKQMWETTGKASELATVLANRLNPAGLSDLVVRPYGEDQIEIIIPNVDELEISEVKRMVQQAGVLKFRILANTRDHSEIFGLAQQHASGATQIARTNPEVKNAEGRLVGIWHTVGKDPDNVKGVNALRAPVSAMNLFRNSVTGEIINFPPTLDGENAAEKWLLSQSITDIDVLVALERKGKPYPEITGDDLANVMKELGRNGLPEVLFNMKSDGAKRMLGLTVANQPDGAFKRQLAIILDNKVLSAPSLNSPIRESGSIVGNFTEKEVDFLTGILRHGSLPAALGKEPISENQIGAALGADTINKGFSASIMSMIATLLFVLLYYRFSGLIACIALLLNMLFILASMILIQQPITLPGLAGLVLTVGMSVDANVLIFERMREEILKKSTGRMAIRNGFDRALTTIIDSNFTTLISAVVLYWVGTDQVRGFAVALVIGILISMFTAVYCSRVFFDIAERWKIVNFSMGDFVAWMRRSFLGQEDVDFMGLLKICYSFSALLILIGLAATAMRGREILDIDFNGGTQVTFTLENPDNVDAIRSLASKILDKDSDGNPIQLTISNLDVAGQTKNTVYRLESSIKDKEDLKKRLTEGFEANDKSIITYRVEFEKSPSSATSSLSASGVKFVSFQGSEQPPATPAGGEATASQPPAETANTVPAESAPAVTQEGAATNAPPNGAAPSTSLAAPPVVNETTTFIATFGQSSGTKIAKIDAASLQGDLIEAASRVGLPLTAPQVTVEPVPLPSGWRADSKLGYSKWKITVPLDSAGTDKVGNGLREKMASQPVWLSVSSIGSRVAGQMQTKAVVALIVSNIFIVIYIWFRFQKVAYGIAAVVALIHDVLITLGFLAISHWLYRPLGFLMIEDFKIGLTIVAAFLTIIGYSLNDTIVVFDRIREVKGKSPRLTEKMINQSVNQTLGRTLLTSSTTLITILLLYIFGGAGIHGFAFCLFIGIVVGTYSSVFVAAPMLLWFVAREEKRAALEKR